MSIDALSKQAVQDCRRKLQTDLWELLHVLYPPPKYYWSESVHKPICEKMFVQKNPEKLINDQSPDKQRLYLDPRNHFKTTIDIVDMAQWILAFPDVRILIASGTRDNAEKMLGSVKSHFKYNETIRYFFPELCPPARKAEDFGTQDAFTCPGRKDKSLREPTCSIASPDSTVAGMHYDVLKFDDLVNETNSRTAEGLKQVNQWYKLTNPLLEPYGYRDVIGTRYDYSDVYGEILGETFPGEDCVGKPHNSYLVTKRGCYLADGSPLFPERFTREKLEAEQREMGTFLFCTPAETPILMADFTEKRIEDVQIGDSVVGFTLGNSKGNAALQETKVIDKGFLDAEEVLEYDLASQHFVRCTKEHRWYSGRSGTDGYHRAYAPISLSRKKGIKNLCFVARNHPASSEASWLGGIFDGEGSISNACNIAFTQTDNKNSVVCERLRTELRKFDFEWTEYRDVPNDKWSPRVQFALLGGWKTTHKFLTLTRPARSAEFHRQLLKHGAKFSEKDRVVSCKFLGLQKVFWLETETGNYVAWGYASKNSAQYFNTPIPSDSQFFPLGLVEKSFIDRKQLPKSRVYFTTLDLAISQSSDANRTAIVTCSIGTPEDERAPRLYVENIVAGHLKPLETVEALYRIFKEYHPMQIRTEEVGFSRLMEPIIKAEAAKRNQYLPMVWIPRDNKEAKVARIAALQPWLERGEMHIVKDINNLTELILELTRFPKYRRDDIIDALADQLALIPMFTGETMNSLPPLTTKCGDARLGLMA